MKITINLIYLQDSDDDSMDDIPLKTSPTLDKNSIQGFRRTISIKQKKTVQISAADSVSTESSPNQSFSANNSRNTKPSTMKLIAVDYSDAQPEATNSVINECIETDAQRTEMIHAIVTESGAIDNIKTTDSELHEPSSLVLIPNEGNTE